MKPKRTDVLWRGAMIWLLFASLELPPAARAWPGALDTNFAASGKVRIGLGGGHAEAYAAAVQADGKFVLAGYGNGQGFNGPNQQLPGGDFLVARFTTNQALDLSFGDGGKVITKVTTNYLSSPSSVANAVAVQADGKIVAAGYSYQTTNYTSFTLVRYNPGGSLDTNFGPAGTGIVWTDFGEPSKINAMLIESSSNILVAGSVSNGYALARYTTNGLLDATFGSGGKVVTSGAGYTGAFNAVLEAENEIIAAGNGISYSGYPAFAVIVYTTNGLLNPTFGAAFTQVASNGIDFAESASALAVQPGTGVFGNPDKLVVAGNTEIHDSGGLHVFQTVLRYLFNGDLDGGFGGGNGFITNSVIPTGGDLQSCSGLAVQGQGSQPRQIIISGYGYDGTNWEYSLASFNTNGAPDTTFGANNSGKTLFPMMRQVPFESENGFEAAATALVPQSGILVTGYRGTYGGEYDFAAVRFTTNGLIDTNFGVDGLTLGEVADTPSQARAVAIQADGKIVAAGFAGYLTNNDYIERFALARLNADGSLDGSFGTNGKQTATFAVNENDQAYAVAVQSDGKIIAAGTSFELARWNTDGSPDPSFGTNGIVTVPIGNGNAQANAIRIQSDGKILVGGYANDPGGGPHFEVARYNTNGTPDPSFGNGGQVNTAILSDQAFGEGIQGNGKIVLAGLSVSYSGVNFAAVRYTTNGVTDSSFGLEGRTTANTGDESLDAGYSMAIQPDGRIVVAGGAGFGSVPGVNGTSGEAYVAVVRFNTNGALDETFGSSGMVLTQVGSGNYDYATSLALQPDGKILVGGASLNEEFEFFALRYQSDGSVDDDYGVGGATLLDFGSETNEFAYGLALDASGRAVLAGDGGGVFGVARLLADVPPVSLKISLTRTNTAVVSWPYPSSGWNLQQTTNLTAGNWVTPPETIANDGTNNYIIVNPPLGHFFFRLEQ